MFDYIAITGPTANWILAQATRRSALTGSILELGAAPGLYSSVLSVGALRLAAISGTNVLAVWNNDLLSGQGYERWGICRLTGENGVLRRDDFFAEIFERFLAIADLRLKGLKLEGAWVHRHTVDDFHTCIAGRGSTARRYSLGFIEKMLELPGGKVSCVLGVGPMEGIIESAPPATLQERKKLQPLVLGLTHLLSSLHTRPALETNILEQLREEFQPATQVLIDYGTGLPSVPPLRAADGSPIALTYDDWVKPESPLSKEQRVILESDIILRTPVRIIGPAGSGKTLLMQLIAIRRLLQSAAQNQPSRIAYVVHNTAMMQSVRERFAELGHKELLDANNNQQALEVLTLTEYSIRALQGEQVPVMDSDAFETKRFQRELVTDFVQNSLKRDALNEKDHPVLYQVAPSSDALKIFAELLVAEFGVAIKAHDLSQNKQGYVLSESPLSTLHSVLSVQERSIVYDIFTQYQACLANDLAVLDSDDLAITVLGKVSTPLWRLRRRTVGYDFIFVDEAQLFNENERRLFPLLTKGISTYVPIALSLDNAQNIGGNFGAGFGTLGFGDLSSESLNKIFRSTPSILKLAFHTIQKSTDLFDASFPDFTASTVSLIDEDHHLAKPPVLLCGGQARSPGRFAVKVATRLRASNLRQICVVVFGDRYWNDVIGAVSEAHHPWKQLVKRGDKIESRGPLIVVSRPEFIGGQEFDAVVCVGLEEGIVPPNVGSNHALAASFEQRALREMYLTFTRARYRLVIANSTGSNLSPLLRDAKNICLTEEKASDWLE